MNMIMESGPHLPQGFDSGLDELLCDPTFFHGSEMTAFPLDDEPMLRDLDTPSETVSSGGAKSQSQHVNNAMSSSGSASPGSSFIFTPTSTQLDLQEGNCHDHDREETSTSPYSNNYIAIEDYVFVGSVDGASSNGDWRINTRPARVSQTLSSSESPHSLSDPSITDPRWQASFVSPSINMDDSAQQSPFGFPAEMESNRANSDEVVSNVGGFEASAVASSYPDERLPFHTFHAGAISEASSANMGMLSQQMAYLLDGTHNLTDYTGQTGFTQYQSSGNAFTPPFDGHYAAGLQTRDAVYYQYLLSMSQNTGLPLNELALPAAIPSHFPSHHANHIQQTSMINQYRSRYSPTYADSNPAISGIISPDVDRLDVKNIFNQAQYAPSKRSSAITNPLVNAPKTGPSNARELADRVRKGGRTRHSHLPERTREKSSVMRRVGACWRCAIQRDPCDHGDPCMRCAMSSQRGQTYFFDCDRSKLPDFVHEFLPPSMTVMHQKQTIEDSVASSVLAWDPGNGIDIYFSSGYGPPLLWKVYEFTPRNDEYLCQLQYYQDNDTDQMIRTVNYSPPYGLLKIDTSDDIHLDSYLDQLLQPQYLEEFGWRFYEAESLADEGEFQASLLDVMCKLYISTADVLLKNLLYDILRMLLITFIMGHTLTISEDTVPTVIANIRHSHKPVNYQQKYTSPRLANRQLKFFFAVLRNGIYKKLLKWQQQTLHTAGRKDATWLSAFCVTLGFAMVLEEVQHTLFIQADASVARGDETREEADRVAKNACERIDARFQLLVGLFQCKYRDKKWGDGSFGPSTPHVRDHASQKFLAEIQKTIKERYEHLKMRENVTLLKENQCYFTSRLTAKFLLPFLQLPG